jgi:hypothetical protein
VLEHFAQVTLANGDPWGSISPNHPRVMYEDILYSTDQQRFKLFRIRTYLVLAWAADGTNFFELPDSFRPSSTVRDNKFTWDRRVLCAIPKPFANWIGTLVWPMKKGQRLLVVLFPPEGQEIAFPKVIFCPLKSGQLLPDGYQIEVAHGSQTNGWVKSHASGCSYHLRN